MSAISFEELDLLSGELLPERAVLSTVLPLTEGGSDADADAAAMSFGGGDHHTTIASACQSIHDQQNAGLLSALGLQTQNPTSSVSCVPGAIAN